MTGPITVRPRTEPRLQAWLVTRDNVEQVAEWAGGGCWPKTSGQPLVWLRMDDLEPLVKVEPGEYVVQGITGYFFRSTAEEFVDAYEVIEP